VPEEVEVIKAILSCVGLAFDFFLFGNGYGLGAPYFAQTFYWHKGIFYTFLFGHGAQLYSRQWTMPKIQEQIVIAGREFKPFRATRKWLRVEVAWAMVLPKDLNEANQELYRLERDIRFNVDA
jgi:hypothetical protein